MRHLPPIPWADVRPGTVIMFNGIPRTVIMNMPNSVTRTVLIEGVPAPLTMVPTFFVQPVELDETDAIGALHAADLNPRTD